jgi:hypothetical protein
VVVDAEKKEKERSVFKNSLTGTTLLEMPGKCGNRKMSRWWHLDNLAITGGAV